jgi:hypothetical protein
MPNIFSSARSAVPNAWMACLVIVYGPDPTPARTPPIDEVMMIRPARFLRIAWATRWVMAKVPKTFTSNTARNRSSGISESGPVWPIAALAMKTSRLHWSTLAMSPASVMSSLTTVSFGCAVASSAAC